MAEDDARRTEPRADTDLQDDVLGKIDQLLNRHRPKAPINESIPLLTDAPQDETLLDDGIPVLTDIVTGPGQPSGDAPATSRSSTISSTQIIRRLGVALDAEHSRLLTQIGDDPLQLQLLERLVTELRRALPAAVRAAITNKAPDPAQSGDDGRL
ncbi:MAG: hypothetical protein ABI648_18060 [Betaproteobacteria bacterium]|jgi:hypothetical protein